MYAVLLRAHCQPLQRVTRKGWVHVTQSALDRCVQELFLQELAARAHSVMQEDERRKGQLLDYKDVGECSSSAVSINTVSMMVVKLQAAH